MQIDLTAMIIEAGTKVMATENLQPKVEKALDEAIAGAIKEAMGYSSEFRTAINKAVQAAMPSGFDGVERIGSLVRTRVTEMLTLAQDSALSQLIDQQLADLIEPVPAELTLTGLMRELTKRWGEAEFDRPEGEAPSFILSKSSYGHYTLYLDKDEGKDDYECDFALTFSSGREGGQLEILTLRVRGEDSKGARTISRRWNDELYLTQLFVGKTQFTMDAHEGHQGDYYYQGY